MSKTDLNIVQGATLARTLRWESPTVVYKTITAITQTAPVAITAVGHAVPEQWRVAVTGVRGMIEINAENSPPRASDYHRATVSSSSVITLNGVDATGYTAYTSGGVLRYNQPVDLTGFTARMQIRASRSSDDYLVELTTTGATINGTTTANPSTNGIVIDTVNYSIAVNISATNTDDFAWSRAVYDLEMVSSAGVVTRLVSGTAYVNKEVTR